MTRTERRLVKDSQGKPLTTLVQAYEMADAWAAARVIWLLLSARDGDSKELPSNEKLYKASALPRLPAAGGPLEAILRGLLQSKPSKRLHPEQAIRALQAMLYGPAEWTNVQRAGAVAVGADAPDGVSATAPSSGAGADCNAGQLLDFVRRQRLECNAADAGTRGSQPGLPASGMSFGVAGASDSVRLPAGEAAYEGFEWGSARVIEGEASLWDRQLRRWVLLRGSEPEEAARVLAADCLALVDAVERYGVPPA